MRFLLLFLLCALRLSATTYYVDSTATGSGTGLTWPNAWTSLTAISGVTAGDTVYISGGATGNSQTYSYNGGWTPPAGTSGNPITYQIGQDSSHNGTAIFNDTSGTNSPWLANIIDVVVSGDAGDGNQHFKPTNHRGVVEYMKRARVAYIVLNSGTVNLFATLTYGGIATTGIELDHCVVVLNYDQTIFACSISVTGSAVTDNKIHHNTISVPHDPVTTGNGADCFQNIGTDHMSIYNNTIIGFSLGSTYLGNEHQDGWQAQSCNNVDIYNNTFKNLGNYCVFMECMNGGYVNMRMFNNLAIITDSLVAGGNPGGFVCGTNGSYSGPIPVPMTNILMANNAVVDFTGGSQSNGFSITDLVSKTVTQSGCKIINNYTVHSPLNVDGTAQVDVTGVTGVTVTNNIALSSATAAGYFTSYALYSTSNDMHLRVAATTLVSQGATLTTDFTTDLEGTTRTVPWDVGPYKYASSAISATPRFPLFQRQPRR